MDRQVLKQIPASECMQTATYKVPGGKLLRIKARVEDNKVYGVQISGDFFLAPHDKISSIEEAIEGFAIEDANACIEVLEYVIQRDNIQIAGFSPQDIAHTLTLFEDQQ